MKRVELVIELDNEKGEIQYAYLYRGVMTRRSIYAKSCMSNPEDKEYIRVKRRDVRTVGSIRSVVKDLFDEELAISVAADLGLDDHRIIPIIEETQFPEGVFQELEQFYAECKEVEKELFKKSARKG